MLIPKISKMSNPIYDNDVSIVHTFDGNSEHAAHI